MNIIVLLSLVAFVAKYGATQSLPYQLLRENTALLRNFTQLSARNFKEPITDFHVKQPIRLKPIYLANPEEVITYYKLKVEKHFVTTSDGYELTLYRIPGPASDPSPVGKSPIFLQHGLFGTCQSWTGNGRNGSLAFILADLGFDVWLGNFRGSLYCRTHQTLNVNQSQFWDYSWHELGIYDLPAMIDYVLAYTGYNQLIYAGHSQGNTAAFVMLSELPEYNDKIKALFSLSPVSFLSKLEVQQKFQFLFYYDSAKQTPYQEIIVEPDEPSNTTNTNVDWHYKNFEYFPMGSSTKQLFHYIQLMLTEHFRKYDYGPVENLKRYNNNLPPNYNLANIRVPTTLFYSLSDYLTPIEDVTKLYSRISYPNGLICVEDPKFGHIDYLWSKNVKELVYDKIVSIIFTYFNR